MADRELLEQAAKAAGIEKDVMSGLYRVPPLPDGSLISKTGGWNPLTDDGDALRLAVKLNLSADFFDDEICVGYTPNDNECEQVSEPVSTDPYAATRRAIVKAAAEIGKGMKDE